MPLLSHPMELRRTPSLARRILRTSLLALLLSVVFMLALAIAVLWVTD
jgi:hypothetical protein